MLFYEDDKGHTIQKDDTPYWSMFSIIRDYCDWCDEIREFKRIWNTQKEVQ